MASQKSKHKSNILLLLFPIATFAFYAFAEQIKVTILITGTFGKALIPYPGICDSGYIEVTIT